MEKTIMGLYRVQGSDYSRVFIWGYIGHNEKKMETTRIVAVQCANAEVTVQGSGFVAEGLGFSA